MIIPNLKEERFLVNQGYKCIVGVDEVGRGAWAGPLVVGVIILPLGKPFDKTQGRRLYRIRDSKLLSKERREVVFPKIINWVDGWATGEVSSFEIDELGLSKAIKLAGKRALESLRINIDFVLLDGNWNYLKDSTKNCKTIKSGDSKCFSIACASIVAKVMRDKRLSELHPLYSNYDFHKNKGYPTKFHLEALSEFGPCEIHRQSYAPIKQLKLKI